MAEDTGFLLDKNKDWSDFVDQVSDNTGAKYLQLWIDHAKENKKRVKECGWAAQELLDTANGKTAVVIGASPALRNQISTLKMLRADDRYTFIGVSSGLKFLLDNDIPPDYCMVMDADPTISRFFEGIGSTKGFTLIASVCTDPKILDSWKGDIKFLTVYTSIPKLNKQFKKSFAPVNGCGIMFPALCSQYNTAIAVAYRILGCRILIFVGNELSFPSEKGNRYYVDREDIKDEWVRKPHPDINGKVVYTTYNFMTLKLAIEDYLQRLFVECVSMEGRRPWFINATEAGIFGVSKRNGNLFVTGPDGEKVTVIYQIPLQMAHKQADSLMKYGQPVTLAGLIQKPSVYDIYSLGGHNNVRFQQPLPAF